jgi:deoxyribonuclease-4
MLIGSHVSMSGKKMLLGAAEEAASYQCDNLYDLYRCTPKYPTETN